MALAPQMQAFNTSMSEALLNGCLVTLLIIIIFKFIDFKKNMRIWLSSVGKIYIVCALLHNALTCLHVWKPNSRVL